MGLEWFDRVSGELPEQLESICEKYDQVGHMSIDRGVKHPELNFLLKQKMMIEIISVHYFSIL